MSQPGDYEAEFSGLPETCRPAVERALVTPAENPRQHERDLGEAAGCLRTALGDDGGNASLWLFLGEIELLRGDAGRAEQAYRQAVELDPDDVMGYGGLAHACVVQGRPEEAEDWLEQGLRVEPTAMLYWQLGQLHLEGGRLEEAEGALRTGLALDPDDEELLFLLARFFARDDDEARRLLEHAVEVAPEHAFAWQELGALHLSTGDLEAAQSCFEHVVELAPDAPDGYRELATLQLEVDPERAIELAREALERDRDDVASWTALGQAQFLADRVDEAERTLLTACAVEPIDEDGARAHWVLAELYSAAGRPEDAIATLVAVEGFAPMLPEIAADLGRAYAELGRTADARTWLQVALEHDIEDETSRALLRELEGQG
jgi:tetratricopeptide (TPR) repeat protein